MSILLIIIIGWLYVTTLMALSEPTIVAGVMSFVFYGLAPCIFPAWLIVVKIRRQRQRFIDASAMAAEVESSTGEDK